MKKILSTLMLVMLALSAFAQKDKFVGFYEGKTGEKQIFAEVFRAFNDTYRLRLYTAIIEKNGDVLLELESLKEKDGTIKAEEAGKAKLNISPTEISGEFNSKKTFLKKIEYISDTMGAKAPAGAVILFDGVDLSKEWTVGGKREPNWVIQDGYARIDAKNSGSLSSKKSFGAVKLHFEFKTPPVYNEPKQQKRGNSGIKFGPYEIQILDSFGNSPCNHYDCGAIYSIFPPQINAALEPDAWQSYDIEFNPAKYENGKLVALPRFTVYLNGVLVQDNKEVPTPTNAKEKKDTSFKHPEKVQYLLQNHQHDVSFRNIWLVEL